MKRIIFVLLILNATSLVILAETKYDFRIFTSTYAYNAENTHWEDTQVTLTYFENFSEGTFGIHFNDLITLRLGAALLTPFSLELPDGMRFFPVVTTELSNEYVRLRLGTLTGGHNLPAPVRDPLFDLTPHVRAYSNNSRMPNGTEKYKYGKVTHGFYEYGMSFQWFKGGEGEIYMNWQLMHTANHRERFDVGLTHALSFIKIFTPYIGLHYWHNGGHEFPFVEGAPAITENYSGSIGINSKELSILYLASFNILDRDDRMDLSKFGQALYIRGKFSVFGWFDLEPTVFVSSFYIDKNQKFIAIEGDPLFRAPFYAGLNITKDIVFANGISINIGFINGIFLTESGDVGSRLDQTIKFNFTHVFDIGKKNDVLVE